MADLTIEADVELPEDEEEAEDTEKVLPDEIPGPLVCVGTAVKGVLTTLWDAIKPSDE